MPLRVIKVSGSGNSGKVEEGGHFCENEIKRPINKHSVLSGEKGLGKSSGHQTKRVE